MAGMEEFGGMEPLDSGQDCGVNTSFLPPPPPHAVQHVSIFPGGADGKESACNVGYPGLIPGLGRSPGEGHGYPSSILAWRIPWTEEPGRLQSTGWQRVGQD